MLKQDDYVKSKLVEMGWRYGQYYSGGHIAGEMVMQALANRVRVGWGSWLQVLDRIAPFMAENAIPPLEHPSIWEPNFVKLLHAVDGVFDGSIADKSKGGLYFGDLAKIERAWFLDKIVRGTTKNFEDVDIPAHPRVANMNGLNFWK